MVKLDKLSEDERSHLISIPCPIFHTTPWVSGPPLSKRRIAIVSTAGLHRRNDRPFDVGATNYRLIPANTPFRDLVMSHISTNFDRTGFQQDINVIFPLDRMRELVQQGVIGSIADYHYSFMGATAPEKMVVTARSIARIMKKDYVDGVLLIPV
ncbi:MAG: glycine/sarcosine/betaine reductase selenoprotein B family protein [Desulfobacterium sp.]|nr:glycine/sarcosine/betaine reductase selenoprotein B family protein [Desulfobacterium sp.]